MNGTSIGLKYSGTNIDIRVGDEVYYQSERGELRGALVWSKVLASVMFVYEDKNIRADFLHKIGVDSIKLIT